MDLEDSECEGNEFLKDTEAAVDQETPFPLEPESVRAKHQDESSAGEADIFISLAQVCSCFKKKITFLITINKQQRVLSTYSTIYHMGEYDWNVPFQAKKIWICPPCQFIRYFIFLFIKQNLLS